MKNFLFASLVLIAVSFCQAQENSEFKKETVEFIKTTGAGAAFENAITQIGTMVPEANKAAYLNEAQGTLGDIYGQIAELYMTEFTQEEIKALVVFYETDLGKKLAEKQLDLTQRAMSFGQAWGAKVQKIAQKHMM
ncbi:DUF2059 domain-containing protein [Algibacter mikhailovii]|uniref:DUF2059 domain-containing protein n=1 Tax=Algibacter mikhailovii TaxID=425498 RepID=A0A918R805_9FLAO|nr:DUF2059 domain-containing protein [Algibacter mikhailovii]GGZ89092.1 hypothetical protein GCM10007028_29120 [Algibacter mikhailovii]